MSTVRGIVLSLILLSLLGTAGCGSPAPESIEQPSSSTLAEVRVEERRVPLRDGEVFYRAAVDSSAADGAAPLVFVHGWASTSWAFDRQFESNAVKALARGRSVLAIDLPGHGQSSPAPEDSAYDLDLFVEAIAAMLDAEKAPPAVLIGHSNGAPVIMRFARRFPDRTAGLVGIDGQVVSVVNEDMVAPMLEPLRGARYAQAVDGMVRGMASEAFDEATLEGLLSMAASVEQAALIDPVLSAANPEMWSEESLEVPLLLVLVEQPTWNEAYRTRVDAMAPDTTWVVWPGANHFLQLEKPEDFHGTLLDWLSEKQL